MPGSLRNGHYSVDRVVSGCQQVVHVRLTVCVVISDRVLSSVVEGTLQAGAICNISRNSRCLISSAFSMLERHYKFFCICLQNCLIVTMHVAPRARSGEKEVPV